MDSRSLTVELEEPSSAPKPPGSLFRIIKALSPGTYLCLPRELPPPFEQSTSVSADLHAKHGSVHSAFAMVPNARLQQQLPLLTYTQLSDVLYEGIRNNGVSLLLNRHLKMAMQVVVVKTSQEKERVRKEVEAIEHLHRASEDSSLHIGSCLLSSQHTPSASTSFAVLRPVFGPNLVQFGSLISLANRGGIPSWLLAHTCLGLLDALQYCHEVGVVLHGKIGTASVVLSLYPTYMHHRYRGYPDVLLVGFSGATMSMENEEGEVDEEEEKGKEEDVRAVLQVMEQVVMRWSGVAPFMGGAMDAGGGGGEGDGAETALLRKVQSILAGSSLGVDHVRAQLAPRLGQMRHEGPDTIPQELMHLLHSDLVTGPELDRAARDPVVIKFQAKKKEMRRIVQDVPVVMGGAGNAGMKTQGIMVMRFTSRKRKFLEDMGEGGVEEDEDVEMGGAENSGAEMADAEMGGTEPAAFDMAVR
jgi:hypothetical protein